MAVARKPKVRMSPNQSKLFDKQQFGGEPNKNDFTEMTQSDLISVLNWYNYINSRAESNEYLIAYYEKRDAQKAKKIKTIDEINFDTSVGWLARMVDQGFDLPANVVAKIDTHVEIVLTKCYREKTPVRNSVNSSIDRQKEKGDNLISDVETLLDSGEQFSVYQMLTNNGIPKSFSAKISDYYRPIFEELVSVLGGSDKDLKEGYRHLKKKDLTELVSVYRGILDDCDRYAENKKITMRKPRKRKAVTAEKKTAKVIFMERFDEFQIVSKSPSTILKAKELWLYDTRYKKIIRYIADENGLDVKGSSLINYNPDLSCMKSTGRKSKEVVNKVLTEGKIGLRKLMDTIKSERIEPSGRINKNMILLKSLT